MKSNYSVECHAPTKRIPAIRISEVDKNMQKDDILEEFESKEGINRSAANVEIILNNTKYRTNRAIVMLSEDDTKRLLKKGEVKMGLKIHPIEPDFGIVQCKRCNKFGHFEKSKDKSSIQCKHEEPVCVHCKVKDDRTKAKCSNCKANHRAYDVRCPRRAEVINKLKEKFICLH